MDLSSLRSLVRNLNFAAHGLPVILESDPPDAFPSIETSGIWLTATTNDLPAGLELSRRERTYTLAVPLVDPVPRGSIVFAAFPTLSDPASGGVILRWKVDGIDSVESDHTRLRLIAAPEISS